MCWLSSTGAAFFNSIQGSGQRCPFTASSLSLRFLAPFEIGGAATVAAFQEVNRALSKVISISVSLTHMSSMQ
jgi:hypothetical protein